jgi:hypothetical protein
MVLLMTSTGNGGCADRMAYVMMWHVGARMTIPLWPRRLWIEAFVNAASEYPANGVRKIKDTVV